MFQGDQDLWKRAPQGAIKSKENCCFGFGVLGSLVIGAAHNGATNIRLRCSLDRYSCLLAGDVSVLCDL